MRRETQNVLLVLVGGALIKIVLDGTYLRYVRPWSGPVVLAAGVVVVLLAVAAIGRDVWGRALPEPGHEHGHGTEHRTGSAWFLLLPVLTILLVAPPALGSGAVTAIGTRTVATLTGFVLPGAGGGHDLARLVISCCAADASVVRVHLADPDGHTQAPAGPGDLWLRVRGRYVAGTGTAADHVPTLRVVEAVPVAAPDPVYEY